MSNEFFKAVLQTGPQSLDRLAERVQRPFARQIERPYVASDFPGGFRFTEIVEDQEPRQVILVGNQMPHAPFGFGGEQRLIRQQYPGNPEPSIQVLGPREREITMRGRFHEKKVQDRSLRGQSYNLVGLIENIRFAGNLLEIVLGEWRRFGYLRETDFDLSTVNDIEYELTFEIIGSRRPRNFFLIERDRELPFDVNQDLLDRLQEEQLLAQTKPLDMTFSIFERFTQLFTQLVSGPVSSVVNFVESAFRVREDIDDSVTRALGLITVARTRLRRFSRSLGAQPYFQPNSSVQEEMTTSSFLAERQSGQAEIMDLMANLEEKVRGLRVSVPERRYIVKDGDTLQKIALKFYNDATQWTRIFDHNELTTSQLESGSVLEIPR